MAQFRFIDLFSGIGGFRLALESAGGTCIGFSEISTDAIRTYCANFNEDEGVNLGDITKIKKLPEHEFMTAGVPCQSWSIAGKNLGFEDDRGQLWNDTLYLLNNSRPKAFIFENVKGLSDPRNKMALEHILQRIKDAGYHANFFIINAYDYGVAQTRVRIYIVGFREKKYLDRFELATPCPGKTLLWDVLTDCKKRSKERVVKMSGVRWSLSCNEQGFNDYFLFNDLRNGNTTIHSWDIKDTTERQKYICSLLLKNRRKSQYGELDGNPLSLHHFQELDHTITKNELDALVDKEILKRIPYLFKIKYDVSDGHTNPEWPLSEAKDGVVNFDTIKASKELKRRKVKANELFSRLEQEGIIKCIESRYDFKNSKISTGLYGVNRIFLPSSKIYPTLVASDTNDFVTTTHISASTIEQFKSDFLEKVYKKHDYRQITKEEACRIQGFPSDFILPATRARWMKLLGNSVAVPVVKMLAEAVVKTGVFDEISYQEKQYKKQLNFYDLLDAFPCGIVSDMVREDLADGYGAASPIDYQQRVLVCLVKKDNIKPFLDRTANIYYTGKRFPSTVELKKIHYFIPYLSGIGIRDLYRVKLIRVGLRKEGQEENTTKDYRLVFEIEFVKQLYDDYVKTELEIWHTYTDTSLKNIMCDDVATDI